MAAPSNPLQVVIVGAGPIGLVTATALAQEGHKVIVLERHPNLQTNGGPILIQSSATLALAKIGLAEKLQDISVRNQSFNFWSYKDGEKPMASAPQPPGSGMYMTDRPSMQRVAYDAAVSAGVPVLFNKRVERLDEESAPPRVYTADGEEYSADLILACDGMKSRMRTLMFPTENLEPIATNECIFQTKISAEAVASDPRIALYQAPGSAHGTLGPGRFTLFRHTDDGGMFLLAVVMQYGSPEADGVNASWNIPGNANELRGLFSDFSIPQRSCLEHVESCTRWRMAEARPMTTWRGRSGRALLLGDAAHAMLPHAAQGVSQGIEGAVSLARLLRWRAKDNGNLPQLLEYFEQFRRPRVEKFISLSLGNAAKHSLADGPEQEARDAHFRGMGKSSGPPVDWDTVAMDMNTHPMSPPFQKWTHYYDAVSELVEFMKDKRL